MIARAILIMSIISFEEITPDPKNNNHEKIDIIIIARAIFIMSIISFEETTPDPKNNNHEIIDIIMIARDLNYVDYFVQRDHS